MPELVITFVVMVVALLIPLILMPILLWRFYRTVPPGKIMVRTGHGGLKVIPAGGVFVIPPIHRADFMHAEVQSLRLDGREILVQVGNTPDEVLQAFHSFGQKTEDEVRQLLQAILDSTDGNESALKGKLAEVGYRCI